MIIRNIHSILFSFYEGSKEKNKLGFVLVFHPLILSLTCNNLPFILSFPFLSFFVRLQRKQQKKEEKGRRKKKEKKSRQGD